MKLKMNKASDLSSISVLPPHARRPGAAESSVLGKSQASQVRSQQQSQPSFSQGFSSQQGIYSQLSQSSLEDFFPNEQRLGSQERENSAKRMSSFPPINYAREDSQMQPSKPLTNHTRKWSVPEYKCQTSEELEHKVGMIETSLSRLGMILDSVQNDIMQVNRGTKEILMEMESLRPKFAAHDELLQLVNKGREDLKATVEGTFKPMFEELRDNKYQENIRDLSSMLRDMPNKLEMCIMQLQTDLIKALSNEIQTIALRPDCPGKKHETAPPGQNHETAPPGKKHETAPPRQKHETALPRKKRETALLKQKPKSALPRQKRQTAIPRQKGKTAIPGEKHETALPIQNPKTALPRQSTALPGEKHETALPGQKHEAAPVLPPKGISDCRPSPEVKFLKKDQGTTLPSKIEMGSWNKVKSDQNCTKQTIFTRSREQKEAFQQERESRVTIESDEDIYTGLDTGFSCIFKENGTGSGILPQCDAKEEEIERILREARRRKRKYANIIIID